MEEAAAMVTFVGRSPCHKELPRDVLLGKHTPDAAMSDLVSVGPTLMPRGEEHTTVNEDMMLE